MPQRLGGAILNSKVPGVRIYIGVPREIPAGAYWIHTGGPAIYHRGIPKCLTGANIEF